MNERIAASLYEEGDLKGLLRRQDVVDLKRMAADVSETYGFLKNLSADERALAVDQHKKDLDRYEKCRTDVRAIDPAPDDPSPAGTKV